MLSSATKPTSSISRLVLPAKHCVRCVRNKSTAAFENQHQVRKDPVIYKDESRLARYRSYLNKPTTENGITATPYNVNIDRRQRSDQRTPSKHVWGRMQDSPKRQCILTRKTFPSDYLIQLKPRYYPGPTPGADETTGRKSDSRAKSGIYLQPNLVKREDGGRSYYLTLHREITSRMKEPGPHLGILQQNDFLIPSKIEDWIRNQLAERLIQELEKLALKLQKHMTRAKNMSVSADEIGMISFYDPNQNEQRVEEALDRLTIRLSGVDAMVEANSATMVDLSEFPAHHRPVLFKTLSRVRGLERKHTLRQAIANGSDLSLPHLRHLIGKSSNTLEGSTITISSSTTRGQLALPTMIALLRWKLYSGTGWESDSRDLDPCIRFT